MPRESALPVESVVIRAGDRVYRIGPARDLGLGVAFTSQGQARSFLQQYVRESATLSWLRQLLAREIVSPAWDLSDQEVLEQAARLLSVGRWHINVAERAATGSFGLRDTVDDPVPEGRVLRAPASIFVGVRVNDPPAPGHPFALKGVSVKLEALGKGRDQLGRTALEGDKLGVFRVERQLEPDDYDVSISSNETNAQYYAVPGDVEKVTCPAGGEGRANFVVEPRWVAICVVEDTGKEGVDPTPLESVRIHAKLPAEKTATANTNAEGTVLLGTDGEEGPVDVTQFDVDGVYELVEGPA